MAKTISELTGGDGDVVLPDLNEEAQKLEAEKVAAAKEITDLRAKPVDQLTPEEKTKLDGITAKETEAATARITAIQAKPEDQRTAEEKAELVKAASTKDAETTDDDADDESTFWDDVDKLRGEKLEIDWTKHLGDDGTPIDPESPQGALIRERAVAAHAIVGFEEHLMKTDPRSYAYILHRQVGGTDEDFFAKKSVTLPDYEEFTKSVDLQQKVYLESLVRRGIGEKQAKALVDQAVKDKEIFDLSDKEYKEYNATQKKELENIQKSLEKEETEYAHKVTALNKMVTDEITSNISMKFVVPDAKKAEFATFVKSHLSAAEGKFFAVQEVSDKTLPRILDSLYLQFINGDISGLIKRSAQTQNTKRLKRTIDQSKKTPAGGDPPSNQKKTLSEIFA